MSDQEGENVDEEELEEQMYSRGRSRSRSMHNNDDVPDGSIVTPIDPSGYVSKGSSSDSRAEKAIERTGPLQHREVAALKKVFNQHPVS